MAVTLSALLLTFVIPDRLFAETQFTRNNFQTCAPFFSYDLSVYDALDYAYKFSNTVHSSSLVTSCEKELQVQRTSVAEFQYGFVLFLNGQVAASREHLKIAYDDGDELAGLVLAVSYLEDPDAAPESFPIFSDIADGGHPVALFFLGMQHIKGRGVEMDFEKGIEFLEEGARRGDRASAKMLADLYTEELDYEKHLRIYEYNAELGFQAAAQVRDFLYEHVGSGYDHMERAFFYLKQAADLGSRAAQREVAQRLRFGIGTDGDVEASFAYLLKSAEGGDLQAQLDVAQCYREGIDPVEEDEKAAFYWAEKARLSEMNTRNRRLTESPFW